MLHKLLALIGTCATAAATPLSQPPVYGIPAIQVDESGRAIQTEVGSAHNITMPAAADGQEPQTVQVYTLKSERVELSPEEGEALTGITFSYQNGFNSTSEPILFNADSLHLWSGMWAPGPLEAPMNGELPPIASHKLIYGFKAAVNPTEPPGPTLINGSFSVAPQADVNFTGFAGYAMAMINLENGAQEIIIESFGALWDDMFSDEYGSMIADQMVYTLIMRHRDCDPDCRPHCHCPAPGPKPPFPPVPATCPCPPPPTPPTQECKDIKTSLACKQMPQSMCHWCDGLGPIRPNSTDGYCTEEESPCPDSSK